MVHRLVSLKLVECPRCPSPFISCVLPFYAACSSYPWFPCPYSLTTPAFLMCSGPRRHHHPWPALSVPTPCRSVSLRSLPPSLVSSYADRSQSAMQKVGPSLARATALYGARHGAATRSGRPKGRPRSSDAASSQRRKHNPVMARSRCRIYARAWPPKALPHQASCTRGRIQRGRAAGALSA